MSNTTVVSSEEITGTGVASVTTPDFNFSGSNRAALLCMRSSTDMRERNFSSSVGGIAGTQLHKSLSTTMFHLAAVIAPPTGSQAATIAWEGGNANDVRFIALALANVRQDMSAFEDIQTTGQANTTSRTLTIASALGNLTVSFVSAHVDWTTNQTLIDSSGSSPAFKADHGPGTAGDITHTWGGSSTGARLLALNIRNDANIPFNNVEFDSWSSVEAGSVNSITTPAFVIEGSDRGAVISLTSGTTVTAPDTISASCGGQVGSEIYSTNNPSGHLSCHGVVNPADGSQTATGACTKNLSGFSLIVGSFKFVWQGSEAFASGGSWNRATTTRHILDISSTPGALTVSVLKGSASWTPTQTLIGRTATNKLQMDYSLTLGGIQTHVWSGSSMLSQPLGVVILGSPKKGGVPQIEHLLYAVMGNRYHRR